MIKYFWSQSSVDPWDIWEMRGYVEDWAKLKILEEKDLGNGNWEWTLEGKKGDLCKMMNNFCGVGFKPRYFIGDLEVFSLEWDPSEEESEEIV